VLSNTVAVFSVPRLTWTDHMFAFVRALVPLGITVEKHSGVYWGQSLSRCISKHLDDGTEYILTLDYDTYARPDDLAELHRLCSADPQIDAVCAVQVRRGSDVLLGGMSTGDKVRPLTADDLAGDDDLVQLATGHFGATVLRVDAIKRMPKPWFHGQPDADGDWGPLRIDDDVWFWRQWHAAGNRLFVAPAVRVGHIQPMVTWPPEPAAGDAGPRHQYISEVEP